MGGGDFRQAKGSSCHCENSVSLRGDQNYSIFNFSFQVKQVSEQKWGQVFTASSDSSFSLHYCYVKITIFHPVVSKIKLRFYLKPVNREYPYSSVGMRAAAIIAMCRTLCPYSPAHKILGNRTTYFSTTHACFQISRKLARCETNS